MIEYGIRQRTRYLHLPYGDQCLFFHRSAYKECGGYKHIPLMEVGGVKAQAKKDQSIKSLPQLP